MARKHTSGYRNTSAGPRQFHNYLLPKVLRFLNELNLSIGSSHVFELGCGNGSVAPDLYHCGWNVTGVDPGCAAVLVHGNINFWPMARPGELLREVGFEDTRFERVERIAPLAKSMITVASKPG